MATVRRVMLRTDTVRMAMVRTGTIQMETVRMEMALIKEKFVTNRKNQKIGLKILLMKNLLKRNWMIFGSGKKMKMGLLRMITRFPHIEEKNGKTFSKQLLGKKKVCVWMFLRRKCLLLNPLLGLYYPKFDDEIVNEPQLKKKEPLIYKGSFYLYNF